MKNKAAVSMDMVNGPLLKNIFAFSVPLMFTSLLQMLFNAADTIVVGKFAGENALAAVGATGSVVFLLISLFNGLSTGSNVVIATLFGQRDDARVRQAVHTSFCIAVIGGLILTVLGMLLARPLLQLMSTPANILHSSTLYMRIYFAGVLFLLIYNFGAAILRSKGDTKRPLYFLIISGILNVVLNLLFVIVFCWSVAGVALATVISEGVAAVLTVLTLLQQEDATRLIPSECRLNRDLALRIMQIGIPAGIQGIVFSLSNVVVQSSINSFGSSTIVAGNSAAANLESFVYIGMNAFTQAAITFTSQNIGASRPKAACKIMWLTMALDVGSALLLGSFVWYFGRFFLGFYTNETAVMDAGMIRLTYVALFLSLNAVLDIFVCSMRGMGYSTVPTILMLVGICGIRLFWLLIIFPQFRSLREIYLCYPISWTVTSVIQGILWFFTYRHLMRQHRRSAAERN